LPARDRLQREHDLSTDNDRINAKPRHRAVGLPAFDDDAEGIGAGHRGPGPVCNSTDLQARRDMKPEYRFRSRIVECALLDHQLGASLLADRQPLLCWLEDKLHRAGQLAAELCKYCRPSHPSIWRCVHHVRRRADEEPVVELSSLDAIHSRTGCPAEHCQVRLRHPGRCLHGKGGRQQGWC